MFQELFTANVVAGLSFLLAELFLHHDLGGNAGVVGTGQPKHFLAFHAGLASQNVLNGVVEHVAHVQHPSDIRRWDDDGEAGFFRGWIGFEKALIQPCLIPFGFNFGGLIRLGKFTHRK